MRATGADVATTTAAAALSELVQSLHAESDAIVRGDVGGLSLAVVRKDQALRQLASELGAAAIPALRDGVRSARDLNRQNARLLSAHLNVTRARVESLLGPVRASTVYSADGHAANAALLQSPQRGIRA